MAMENNVLELPESQKSPNIYITARGSLRKKSTLKDALSCSTLPQRLKPPTLPATTSGPNIVILPIQRHSAITSVSAPAAIFIIIAYVAYTSCPTTVPSLHPWSSLQPAGDLRTWTLQQGHLFFRQLAFRNTPVRPSGSSASVYGRSERAGLSGLLVAFHNHSACHDHREAHHRLAKTWDLMAEGEAETGGDD
jgi:hypothetical protein